MRMLLAEQLIRLQYNLLQIGSWIVLNVKIDFLSYEKVLRDFGLSFDGQLTTRTQSC